MDQIHSQTLDTAIRTGLGLLPDSYVMVLGQDGKVVYVEVQETTPTTQFDARLPGILALGPKALWALSQAHRDYREAPKAVEVLREVRATLDRIDARQSTPADFMDGMY